LIFEVLKDYCLK